MHIYRNSFRKATCAGFAREAALDAFGPRAIHALDDTDSRDRKPLDDLHDPEEAVDGREAISRWLKLAATVEGEAAETAYETADELRQVLGLEWTDLIRQEAA